MDIKIKRGQILKDLRKNYKDAKLNQADVANIIGVSVQAYQKYEYGTAEPTFDAISKLADFYNVSVDYLLGRETNKQIDYIQQLADEKGLDSSQRGILAAFCYMDDAGREKLLDSSGLPTGRFTFEGFLTVNKKSRREQEQPVKQSTTLGTLEDQMEEAAKTKEEASS